MFYENEYAQTLIKNHCNRCGKGNFHICLDKKCPLNKLQDGFFNQGAFNMRVEMKCLQCKKKNCQSCALYPVSYYKKNISCGRHFWKSDFNPKGKEYILKKKSN